MKIKSSARSVRVSGCRCAAGTSSQLALTPSLTTLHHGPLPLSPSLSLPLLLRFGAKKLPHKKLRRNFRGLSLRKLNTPSLPLPLAHSLSKIYIISPSVTEPFIHSPFEKSRRMFSLFSSVIIVGEAPAAAAAENGQLKRQHIKLMRILS